MMKNRAIYLLLAALCIAPTSYAEAQADHAEKVDTTPPEFREMQQVEDRWSAAVAKRDQYALELVLAPQFIGISASGEITTRNQQIAHLFLKNTQPDSLTQKVVSVRFVGDVAVVNGTYVMTWKNEKTPVVEKGIFSHVFARERSTWLCFNSQQTVIAEETGSASSQKKPNAKHSDAALPMHIPLVYKGPESSQAPPAQGAPPNQ